MSAMAAFANDRGSCPLESLALANDRWGEFGAVLTDLGTGVLSVIAWFRKLPRLISQRAFPLRIIFEVMRDRRAPYLCPLGSVQS
jgi:hypothetical protein